LPLSSWADTDTAAVSWRRLTHRGQQRNGLSASIT